MGVLGVLFFFFFYPFKNFFFLPVGLFLARVAGDFCHDVLQGGVTCFWKNIGVLLSNLEGKSKLTSSEKQLGVGGRRGEKNRLEHSPSNTQTGSFNESNQASELIQRQTSNMLILISF